MKIYLAGSVPKGDLEGKVFHNWRIDYENILKSHFPDANFVDPFDRNIDESDFFLVFGLDCKHIKTSDLIIVNAENTLGAGTSQELLIAKYFKKPVITILPKNTKHRRTNINFNGFLVKDWIHPFIFSTSDFILENISEFSSIKDKVFSEKVKDISIIDESIERVDKI